MADDFDTLNGFYEDRENSEYHKCSQCGSMTLNSTGEYCYSCTKFLEQLNNQY